MTVLVTGAAGFIGYHVCRALLARGIRVVGIDNLNDYYDPALKRARLDRLAAESGFSFHKLDAADRTAVLALFEAEPETTGVVHEDDPTRASVEIEPGWLDPPGRYMVEIKTKERTHFPLRRYVIEVR